MESHKTGLLAIRTLLGQSVPMSELKDFWGSLTDAEKAAYAAQAEADPRENPPAAA